MDPLHAWVCGACVCIALDATIHVSMQNGTASALAGSLRRRH